MEPAIVQELVEKQVLTVVQAVEDKLDEEIVALDWLNTDDLEALRDRLLQQMKKMAERRARWVSLGHDGYYENLAEKDFFSVVKASDRVVCHFYRENWPCKLINLEIGSQLDTKMTTYCSSMCGVKGLCLTCISCYKVSPVISYYSSYSRHTQLHFEGSIKIKAIEVHWGAIHL